jgi:hypothetical protein
LCCEESFGTESEGIREKGGIDMTADTAIDSIYAVYGQQTSVTKIIDRIKSDQKSGMLNPNLRV